MKNQLNRERRPLIDDGAMKPFAFDDVIGSWSIRIIVVLLVSVYQDYGFQLFVIVQVRSRDGTGNTLSSTMECFFLESLTI